MNWIRSVRIMEVLRFLFIVVLASAAELQDVSIQESVLDVYVSNSQLPAFRRVDLYQGPVIVLANTTQQQDNGLVAYYADNGLRSIVDSRKFQPLYQLLRASSNVSGLVISYQGLDDSNFLLNVVRDFVLPDNFKLYDLVRDSVCTVPIVYVAPNEIFSNHSFEALEHVARFVVNDFNIDQVPVNKSYLILNNGSVNVSVILIPIYSRGYPYNHYSKLHPIYDQNSESFPFKYQNPVSTSYFTYQLFGPQASNNRGTSSFPLYGVKQSFNSFGHNYQYPHTFSFSNPPYLRYFPNFQYSKTYPIFK